MAEPVEGAGDVKCGRRLSDAALLICEDESPGVLGASVQHPEQLDLGRHGLTPILPTADLWFVVLASGSRIQLGREFSLA